MVSQAALDIVHRSPTTSTRKTSSRRVEMNAIRYDSEIIRITIRCIDRDRFISPLKHMAPTTPPQLHPQRLNHPEHPENSPLRTARTQGPHHPLERQRPARYLRRRPPTPPLSEHPRQKRNPLSQPRRASRDATPAQITTAAQATWQILQRKWRTISGRLDLMLDEAHPLGFWCKVMLELHRIHLPVRQ